MLIKRAGGDIREATRTRIIEFVNEAMSSIASISHRNVFGLKQDVKNNISFIDEQTILYPAGANVILYNIENKAQKFIHTSEKSLGITCLSISGNRRFCQVNL